MTKDPILAVIDRVDEYVLVVIVCLGGECEVFVWRDMLSNQECSSAVSEIGKLYGPGWSVLGAVCQRMSGGTGREI